MCRSVEHGNQRLPDPSKDPNIMKIVLARQESPYATGISIMSASGFEQCHDGLRLNVYFLQYVVSICLKIGSQLEFFLNHGISVLKIMPSGVKL